MTTIEIINEKNISIDWEFIDIQDRHDNNWCEWTVSGVDEYGNIYLGSCQADGSSPDSFHDSVTDIEQIKL